MLRNNPHIKSLMHECAIGKLSELKGISLQESKEAISQMSFSQYLSLLEASADITPPSGQAISPSPTTQARSQPTAQPVRPTAQSSTQSQKPQVMWQGQGSPIEQGMTVGLKGTSGLPVPGEITQVDTAANGVKVRNPDTGQDEWHSNNDLEQYVGGSTVPGQQPAASGQPQVAEDIARMRKLAGIAEDASCGATGASGIAVSPTNMGNVKRRTSVAEAPPKEYTPKHAAKTIAGDTKPHQASGELSANLAARGKKTASRTNNGIKR